MLRRLALTALLLPGCLEDNWKTEHREPIEITLADVDPGLRVVVEENKVVLSLDIERDEEECFHLNSLRVTLDGVDGAVSYGGWSQTSAFNPDQCIAPGASFELPKAGPASFVVSSHDSNVATRWTMDIELRSQPITWSNSTPVYHTGDTVTINVPSLGAAQIPTIHIYNAEVVVGIDANDIVRVGTEARFEIPELPSVRTPMAATMDVSAMVSPTVVRCAAPKGCTAAPFQQTLSSSISLAP